MADLIEKFFLEDLSDAESSALGEELLSSDEAARKFGERAQRAYQDLGLPDPQWKGPDQLPQTPDPPSRYWVWLGFLLVALLALLTGWLMNLKKEEVPLSHSPKPHVSNALEKKILPASQPLLSDKKAKASIPLPVSPAMKAAAVSGIYSPQGTPVNVDQNPAHPFSSLSVSLRLVTSRTLSVEVLNAAGNEILPLFKGTLPAGNWAFEWNGLLPNGLLAPPGRYRIQVQSGSYSQTKDVLIQK